MAQCHSPPKRSAGALKTRRIALPWPKDQPFRILSIDGGGIRGVFPASLLAGLEERLSNRRLIDHFDLIAGTSTGGIIALGLACGLRAADMRDLYVQHGCEVFPPPLGGSVGGLARWLRSFVRYRYDRDALDRLLGEHFGSTTLGECGARLCIPSVDGRYGETYIFKTPHHPDFKKDASERIVKVAASTAAAPTFFQPLEDGGYTFLDGGLFANDPIMVGLVDALSCFDVSRDNVHILSIGCGGASYRVAKRHRTGGLLAWRDVIDGAIHFQSLSAQGQAALLVGADHVVRVTPTSIDEPIALDDWQRAVDELVPEAARTLRKQGETIANMFLREPVLPYRVVHPSRRAAGHRRNGHVRRSL